MADARKKLPQITTPKGKFRFPKLTEPDYGNEKFPKPDGEYSVQLVLDQDSPEAKDLLAKLDPLHKEAMAEAKQRFDDLPVGTRKKLKEVIENPVFTVLYDKESEEPTGEIVFKAAMKASGEYKKGPKQGSKWARKPMLFDARGRRMEKISSIWSGTVGKLSVEVSNYFIPGTGAAGIKLNLQGVQIIDLVAGGQRTAGEMGFGVEDGYEHDEAMFEEPSNDAKADASADADEGNF